jgi:peptidoglycan hydrolase-like protein with peptidoglycan-binding domain
MSYSPAFNTVSSQLNPHANVFKSMPSRAVSPFSQQTYDNDTRILNPHDLFLNNPGMHDPRVPRAQSNFSFLDDKQLAPSCQEIRQGKVLEPGQSGITVMQVQKMLGKAGFPVKATGEFGETTQKQLKAFQASQGISATGKVGPTTLKALEAPQARSGQLARAIADTAKSIALARGTVGWCYNAVADAIEANLPDFMYGERAWMAADQLADHPRFKEIKPPADMNKLPVGAVVVWAKGSSESGHISVYLGNGREASDHVADQMQSHYGGGDPRVFLPI